MSTEKIITATSKKEDKENKPAAVARRFKRTETLLEQAMRIQEMQGPFSIDLPSQLPHSCKIITHDSSNYCKAVSKFQMPLLEAKLQSPKSQALKLNEYQQEALKQLKDEGLTQEHFSNQSWFNSDKHVKGLKHLMRNTPTNPDRALDALRNESQDFIDWLAKQYDDQASSETTAKPR